MSEETDELEANQSGKGKSGLMIWVVVMTLSIAGGAATPIVIAGMGHKDDKAGMPVAAKLNPTEEYEFIAFDEVTVNLDEARFSRYLRINFSLQVGKSQRAEVEKQLAAKKIICKNWLQVHVAEKTTEDLGGKFGRNRLRREIHDFFNEALFDDGLERIQDVLFSEFVVQ
jgi:flagellar basal body-associated protein FliL